METINFYPKTFKEIPYQDNPAMAYAESSNPEKIEDCLMLVKNYTNDHTIILHIGSWGGDRVKHVASVWDHEIAKALADYYGSITEVSNEEVRGCANTERKTDVPTL